MKISSSELVLDTGPLLLFLTGLFNADALKHVNYNNDDFLILFEFLKRFSTIMITPNVLTEVSNLANTRHGLKERFSDFLNHSIDPLSNLIAEEYVPKHKLLQRTEFPKFGVTDASLIDLTEKKGTLLTDDNSLFWYCANKKISAIHMDTLRSLSFQF